MTFRIFAFLCLGAMMSCAATGTTSSSTNNGNGSASSSRSGDKKGAGTATLVDTKKYRPTFPAAPKGGAEPMAPAAPTNHVGPQVTLLMDSVAQVQRNIKYAAGYRILAYTGIERQTAMNLRNNIIRRLPEEKDYLTYKQPTYQLKIGDFFTRVEAQNALNKIQDLLPNALLVQETINIPK
ncbi:sporulation protein [Rufibacter latericius]|uniref:Sporulation protein n=1 Tax=Rufibacter latericius TaxID=2487040 RepID=A0A3M9MKJ8_9BACT|nr:sporulation protein [Rufibacter latericius]RNI26064.1 sporulation protein [Rufibacter latericius]